MDRAVDEDSTVSESPRHIDAIIPDNGSDDETDRKAEMSRTEEWGTIGLPIFLTPEELEKQGIDPEETDKAIIRVKDGFLLIDTE